MKIQFDDANLMAAMVGDAHGVTQAEWRAQCGRGPEVVRGFRALVDRDDVGFPRLPLQTDVAREILSYARKVRGSYDTVCLLGIGGSALGAWALDCALRGPHVVQEPASSRHPRLVILDNVDPAFVEAALDTMDRKKTLVLAISKQGTTAETLATLLIVRQWLGKRAPRRMVAITGPASGDLYALAEREGWQTFVIPKNVGGRFSVLSPVGLLPAALIGLDILRLLEGAARMTDACWGEDPENNLALRAALLDHLLWIKKNKGVQVAWAYSNRLWGVAFWFRQLWAESLGKAETKKKQIVHVGQTPVAALGVTDQHSQLQLYAEGPNDKVFYFWAIEKFPAEGPIPKERLELQAFDYLCGRRLAELLEAERLGTTAALTEAGRPNATFLLERMDEEHLGAFLQLQEFRTAFMGELLGINAFDQPGVEESKRFTYGLLGRPGFEEYLERYQDYERRRKEARG